MQEGEELARVEVAPLTLLVARDPDPSLSRRGETARGRERGRIRGLAPCLTAQYGSAVGAIARSEPMSWSKGSPVRPVLGAMIGSVPVVTGRCGR